MPRARNIKPSFFTDDELAEGNCPLGRLFFEGLWCHADYQGNLEWRPGRLKVQILPYDECEVEKLAINLDKSGHISFYSDGEKIYLKVNEFEEHQNPHKNERDKGTKIPEFTEKRRQLIDLNTLTIIRDKSGGKREDSASDPADSGYLIPDSGSPQTETPAPEPDANVPRELLEEWFETLWSTFNKEFGSKGPKTDAENYFIGKLKPDRALFTEMLISLQAHIEAKTEIKRRNPDEFCESFPHVVRWLKKERWKDEIPSISNAGVATSARDEALYRKYPHLRPQ